MANGPGSQGHYLVAASEDSIYVRVVGLATMTNSARLQDVLDDVHRRGVRRFIFDLENCSGFDSTFMGILVGVAQGGSNGSARNGDGDGNGNGEASVILVNAAPNHSRLLSGVGIDRMVHLHPGMVRFPGPDPEKLEDEPVDPLRRIRSMVSAHENLIRLGGANVEKFGAMLDALKRELGA